MNPVDALYVHVPLCASLCPYCSFTSVSFEAGDPAAERHADALAGVLERVADTDLGGGAATAYIGGGTPSILGADSLARLVAAVANAAGPNLTELTVEANPDSFDANVAAAAVAAGATRFSIGIQSFCDETLKSLGRIHDAAAAEAAVKAAIETGARVSLDLMCGVPGQTLDGFFEDVRHAVDMGIEHVSVYPLSIEEHTAFGELVKLGAMSAPDDDLQADMMEGAARVLEKAGLVRYEVASYARPGCESRHNIAYWTGKSYLGLGIGASSMLSQEQWEAAVKARLLELSSFLATFNRGHRVRLSPATQGGEAVKGSATLCNSVTSFSADVPVKVEAEFLSEKQALAEDLMLAMRMKAGAGEDLVARTAVLSGLTETVVDTCIADGLATWDECDGARRLCPTERGWLLGNELFGRMWGLAE